MGHTDKPVSHYSVLLYNGSEPLPKQGGMERVTDNLARGLTARGVKVILLCKHRNRLGEVYSPPCKLVFVPDSDERVFIKRLIIEEKITHIIDQSEGAIVGSNGFFKEREGCFNGLKLIAVQHSNPKQFMDNYDIIMRKDSNVPLIEWLYNKLYLKLRKTHSIRYNRTHHRELNRNYDRIVLLSTAFISDFMHFCPDADCRKLRAIPNMNLYSSVRIKQKKNRVLFVGRLSNRIKGCDRLLRIWKMAHEGMPGWHLDIVGDGPDKNWLESYARDIGLTDYSFHGFQNPSVFYEEARIFCLTSTSEGFGMVLTEAMQHAVVPIAFDNYAAVKDIINDGIDGILIPPYDEQIYAQELKRLMTDCDRLTSMSCHATESVTKFSIDKVIDKWIQLLDEK